MSWVEISKEKVSSLKNSFLALKEYVSDIKDKCLAFERNAVSYSGTWVDLYFEVCSNGSIYNKNEQRFKKKKKYSLGINCLTGEEEFEEKWVFNPEAYNAAIKQWIIERATEHNSYIVKIGTARTTIEPYVEKFESIESALQKVIEAVDTFEEHSGDSVSAILSPESSGGTGVEVGVLDFGENGTYIFDGTYFVSEDGKTKYGLGELVNSFYSYMGMYTGSAIALAGIDGMTDEKYRELLKLQATKVYDQTQAYLSNGYYSATSLKNIEAMYHDAFPEGDYSRIGEQYSAVLAMYGLDPELANGVNGEWFKGAAVAGLFAGAFKGAFKEYSDLIGNGKDGPLSDDEIKELEEKYGLKNVSKENPADEPGGSPSDDGDGGNQGPGGGGAGGDGSGIDGEGAPGTDGLVLSDEITLPTKDEIPDVIPEALEMTSEQADDIAVEKFYDQFEDETALAEYRQAHVREFDEMSNDQGALEEFFENAGYSAPEAEYISQNKELGLSAFLAAKQSADLLSMSTQIAQESGMDMTLFDSRFDDRPNYSALSSGDVNSFLTNPNYDADVSVAKAELTTAKTEYDTRVTKANESIQKATEAKEELEKVKEELVKEAGNNTKKWNDKQVEKYNEAAKKYNDSVEQANEDYKAVEEAKTEYEATKENYENVKQEYLDSIKESSSQGQNVQPETDSSITENGEVHVYGNSSEPNVEAAPDNTGTSESVASGNDSFGGEEYVFEDNFISDPNSATDSLPNTNVDNNPGIEVSEDSVVIK